MQGNRHFASIQHTKSPIPKKSIMKSCVPSLLRAVSTVLFGFAIYLVFCSSIAPAQQVQGPELTRTVRSWEFLPVVGTRAGLFGNETGRFEAWVYPLKIFREFHLTFHVDDRGLPAESLARTLTVRPESASILYAGDSFRVRETLCVPLDQQGAVIQLEVETEQPVEIEASFI